MELLERSDALNKLKEALQQALVGSGRFLLISGEAGIGKTSLVEQFIRRQTTRVLWGACDALFTPRPLGPLHDMAAQLRGDLLPLLEGTLNRPAIFAACLTECQIPGVFVFEDIHWADEATLDLLRFLGRRMPQTSSLLIATFRDDELGTQHPLRLLVGDLVRHPGVERLGLTPLSLTAVRQLAHNYGGDPTELHRQTGGNPFFVNQVLISGEAGIPDTVRDVVLARAARLTLSGRVVLNATAVIGQRIEPWLLKAVTQAEAPAIDESLALGLLLVQGENFVFRHELARKTILDAMPPHQRTFWHQAVLDALKTSLAGQKDLAQLAHHAEAAGDEEAILTYARAAGKEAAALGMYRAAAAQFALALRYADSLPLMEQIELNESYAISVQGDPARTETIAAYRRAAALARQANHPLREGFELVRLAGVLDIVGEYEESERLLNEALALLEPLAPNRGLIDAYRVLAVKHLGQGEAETAVAYAEKSYQMALGTEQVHIITSAYQVMGLCWLPLDHETGCSHLEKCLMLCVDNNQHWAAAAVYPNLIMTYVDVFRLDRAQQLLNSALPYTAERDMDASTQMLQAWQAMIYLYRGRWDECAQLVETVQQQPALQFGVRGALLVAKGRLLARQGEAEKARSLLEEGLALTRKIGNMQRMGLYFCACAEEAWLAGDEARLRALVGEFYETAVQNRQCGFAAELAYWRWHLGEAVETFDWMVRPFSLEIHGQWREAAAAWEALGCPYEQARALADGDTAALLAALAIFEQLEARPMVDVVRQKLRAAGAQTIPRGPRPATRENPFQLTNRQMQILALLTEELTNAEIAARLHISPKTVDHHVSAVLGKLSVSSREEAAVLARQSPELRPK